MTSVTGLEFSRAWKHRITVDFGGEAAPVLSRQDVLKSKIAAGRLRDGRDAKRLGSDSKRKRSQGAGRKK
jgi:hypothetical protein